MKKFVCILLALVMAFALSVSAFAADEATVTAKKADGTEISKPVSEVVKTVEEGLAELKEIDADRAAKLEQFFTDWEKNEDVTVIAKGIVCFDGAFEEAEGDEIEVPLSAAGLKADNQYGVILSTGTSKLFDCKEDGTVVVAFPKDADYIGYVITAEKVETFEGTMIITTSGGNTGSPVVEKEEP